MRNFVLINPAKTSHENSRSITKLSVVITSDGVAMSSNTHWIGTVIGDVQKPLWKQQEGPLLPVSRTNVKQSQKRDQSVRRMIRNEDVELNDVPLLAEGKRTDSPGCASGNHQSHCNHKEPNANAQKVHVQCHIFKKRLDPGKYLELHLNSPTGVNMSPHLLICWRRIGGVVEWKRPPWKNNASIRRTGIKAFTQRCWK